MGKISQSSAHEASLKIVEPINKKISEVNKEIKELLTMYYRETIPVDVMKFWKKTPEYIKCTNSIYVKGIGISGNYNSESVESTPRSIEYSTPDLNLSKEQSTSYLKLVDKRDDLKEKYKNTQKEIEVAILNLATHKRVIEFFPELADYFPESVKQTMQMTVQLSATKEKIKCLISPEKEKKCIEKL